MGVKRRIGTGLVSVAAIAMLFSACSENGKAAVEANRPPGKPIKLMVIAPVDSSVSDLPDIPAAAKAAELAINNAGGVAGRPIEVDFCNNKSNANDEATCARRAASEGYAAVVGHYTIYGNSSLPILSKAKVPSIGNVVTTPSDYLEAAAYPFSGGQQTNYIGLPMLLADEGVESVAVAALDADAAQALIKQVEIGAEAAGIDVAGRVLVPLDTTDYAPYAIQLKDLKPDAVIEILTGQQSVQLVQAASQNGYDVHWANQALSIGPEQAEQVGALGARMTLADALPPASDESVPGIEQFNDDMDYAADLGVEGTENRRYPSVNAWAAVHAFKALAEQIKGKITNETVWKQLGQAADIDVLGLTTWSPAKAGPELYPRVAHAPVYHETVEDGAPKLVSSDPLDVFEQAGLR